MAESKELLTEISELKSELADLKLSLNHLADIFAGKSYHNKASTPHQLRIFIGRGTSRRKPYAIFIDGLIKSNFTASPVRTTIFLMLLLDLRQRASKGFALQNLEQLTERHLKDLELEGSDDGDSENKLRVAAYRFFDFCESKGILNGESISLIFDHDAYCLEVRDANDANLQIEIDISSDLPAVSRIISQFTGSISLAEIRKQRVVYVPSGESGTDQLLLAMYDHEHELEVTSLYVRPPFASYPEELLKKIGISPLIRKRKELAFQGYRDRRFKFEEILTLPTIQKLIQKDPEGNFICYPLGINDADVLSHLDNLIHILETYPSYNLYLTDIQLPFVFVNYYIHKKPVPENYLVFFQSNEDASRRDMGCLVMSDPATWQGIKQNVLEWVMNHPATITERSEVIQILQETRQQLAGALQ